MPLASQTAGPNGLTFFWTPPATGSRGCFFPNKKKFHGQRRALQLVIYIMKTTFKNIKIQYLFRAILSEKKNESCCFL